MMIMMMMMMDHDHDHDHDDRKCGATSGLGRTWFSSISAVVQNACDQHQCPAAGPAQIEYRKRARWKAAHCAVPPAILRESPLLNPCLWHVWWRVSDPPDTIHYQLVGGLEHEFYDFPFSWECHHPNWRTHIFQRGRHTTNQYQMTCVFCEEQFTGTAFRTASCFQLRLSWKCRGVLHNHGCLGWKFQANRQFPMTFRNRYAVLPISGSRWHESYYMVLSCILNLYQSNDCGYCWHLDWRSIFLSSQTEWSFQSARNQRNWRLGTRTMPQSTGSQGISSHSILFLSGIHLHNPGCNFLYRIRGVDTQKAFDSVEPVCTPTVLQNQGPWAGKHPKTTHFGHFWTVSW